MVEMSSENGALIFKCKGGTDTIHAEALLLLATVLNKISEGDEEELRELIEITREALPEACRYSALIGKSASIDKI